MNTRLLAVILALVSVAAIIIATQSFMSESDTVVVVPQNNLHTSYTDDVRPILDLRCSVDQFSAEPLLTHSSTWV